MLSERLVDVSVQKAIDMGAAFIHRSNWHNLFTNTLVSKLSYLILTLHYWGINETSSICRRRRFFSVGEKHVSRRIFDCIYDPKYWNFSPAASLHPSRLRREPPTPLPPSAGTPYTPSRLRRETPYPLTPPNPLPPPKSRKTPYIPPKGGKG